GTTLILPSPRLGLAQEDSGTGAILRAGKAISIGYLELDVPVQDASGELGYHFLRDILPLESHEDALDGIDWAPRKAPPPQNQGDQQVFPSESDGILARS
ncbi:MAG: hypothetical protein RLZZ165_891, partial [Bacteroidota bacterium]